jgi:hypothetical protein
MMPAPSQRDEVAALGDELAAVRVIVERLDGENRELSEANARLRQDLEVKGCVRAYVSGKHQLKQPQCHSCHEWDLTVTPARRI